MRLQYRVGTRDKVRHGEKRFAVGADVHHGADGSDAGVQRVHIKAYLGVVVAARHHAQVAHQGREAPHGIGKRKRSDGGRLDWKKKVARDKRVFAGIAAAFAVAVALTLAILISIRVTPSEAKASIQLYKNPQCTCCEAYASYLRNHGYAVTTTPTHNLSLVRREHGVPTNLAGCHTMLVEGYVVEGHVPVGPLNKLLAERPKINGISLPGMPDGSPGMTGRKSGPFTIYEISDGEQKVYAVE